MRSKNKTIPQHLLLKAIVFSLLFTVEFTFAQAALTASGGEAVGAGGSLSYSIGQVDYIKRVVLEALQVREYNKHLQLRF